MEAFQRSDSAKIKKMVLSALLALCLLAGLICLVVDVAVSRAVSWSLYPIGALALLLCACAPALLCGAHRAEYTALALLLSISAYLFLVQRLSGTSGWALPLGVPLTAVGCGSLWAILKAFQKLRHNKYYACAVSLVVLFLGPALLVDLILAANGILQNNLTQLILAPVLLLAVILLVVLGRRKARLMH